jgi:hypothetical protein
LLDALLKKAFKHALLLVFFGLELLFCEGSL